MGLDTYVDITFKRNGEKITLPIVYMRKCYSMAQNLSASLCCGDFDAVLDDVITAEEVRDYLEDLRTAYQDEINTLCSIPEGECTDDYFDSIWELPTYLQILHRCLYKIDLTLLFFQGRVDFFDLVERFEEGSQLSDTKLQTEEEDGLGVKDFEYEFYFCNSY
mgnify:CR=1 FL=1|jgi:hypothetical protein